MSNGIASCCNGKTMFVTQAFRWGEIHEGHSYIVGVFTTKERAEFAGKAEELYRGGKYECVVYEHAVNFIEPEAHAGYTSLLEFERGKS